MYSDLYKTITQPAEGIYKDKGSKFLAFAYPITNIEDVKPLVDALKSKYYDARHHCFAYRLGQHGQTWRAVDDGEPSATAGRPILGQLQSAEITNVLVVVVRYFGGTKLGVSGLINAYKEATVDVISNAEVVERTLETLFLLEFGYTTMNDVMRVIKECEPQILEQTFDNLCRIKLSIRRDNAEIFRNKCSKIEGLNIDLV